ncbi:MAG: tRNA dihydrouridine synthase DusB [Ruminococcaceae bacterium]|nr:tRNA dihydrouridine synthase DusB [Oscillospiraceae bacterium]
MGVYGTIPINNFYCPKRRFLVKKKLFSINGVWLAPMAGVTDAPYRALCKEHGAAVTISEMISAKALTMGDKKTALLLAFSEEERPFGIQLFGYEAKTMVKAAAIVEERYRPDFIDINMGCPTPKIVNNGSGSALMKNPELAAAIVRAVDEAVLVPVTVKMRAGYSEITAPCLAPLLESAGAAAITIHGRTREQMYRPSVNLSVIREVKSAVTIPVIGNGDVASPQGALKMLGETGCDAVMVGRGCLGNPFIFEEINAALSGADAPNGAGIAERMEALRRLAVAECSLKPEKVALLEMRKHAAWFTKGFRGASAFRQKALSLMSLRDLDEFISLVLKENENA